MTVEKRTPVIVYLLVFVFAFTCIAAYSPNERGAKAADSYVVVVDPGHIYNDGGGNDPGAFAPGNVTSESKITPVLAKKIAQQLIKKGYTVYTTLDVGLAGVPVLMADQAPYISVTKRAEASNKAKADLFLSVHCNHNGSTPSAYSDAHGAELLYNMYQDQYAPAGTMEKSVKLGKSIYKSLAELGYTAGRSETVKYEKATTVLMKNRAPAVTLEAGFMTNRTDLANLQNPTKQNQMAAKVAEGVVNYFAENGKKDTAPPTAERVNTSKTPSAKPRFTIAAYGVKDESGVASVNLEVYRKGRKSKGIKTLTLKDKGNGKWSTAVDVKKLFGDKPGVYIVDLVAADGAGNPGKIATVRLEYRKDKQAPTFEEIRTSANPSSKPKFTVSLYGVKDESGVRSITYKVYPSRKKARAVELKAKNKGGGKYSAAIDVRKWFGGEEGVYVVDIFGEDKKDNKDRIGRVKMTYRKSTEPGPVVNAYSFMEP